MVDADEAVPETPDELCARVRHDEGLEVLRLHELSEAAEGVVTGLLVALVSRLHEFVQRPELHDLAPGGLSSRARVAPEVV